jgi:transposase
LRCGHSKDHRPDLPPLKIKLSTLDPLGLPLTAPVVKGNCAEAPLSVPAIDRGRATWQKHGLLFVGDSKMAARATRPHGAAGGDYYLCPLPATPMPAAAWAALLAPVRAGEQSLTPVWRRHDDSGRKEKRAEGDEYEVPLSRAEEDGSVTAFTERRLVVRSLAQSRSLGRSWQRRLTAAQHAIRQVGKKRHGQPCPQTEVAARPAVDPICRRYQVADWVRVSYDVTRHTQPVRAYGIRPAREELRETLRVRVQVDPAALADARFLLGWRGYATNAPPAHLSLAPAVVAYRGSYLSEHGFRRVKGHPVSLTPLYLTPPGRRTGLVRVLLIGLRVLGLLEYKARRALTPTGEPVAGLPKGLPRKATARPTAAAILQAFAGLTLFQVAGQWYLTPLNALQQRLLLLLGFSADLYHDLLPQLSQSQVKMSET